VVDTCFIGGGSCLLVGEVADTCFIGGGSG
jgi:carbonic anhydrase/acetyltransferase-like protein (isoleucine patch superfamily)